MEETQAILRAEWRVRWQQRWILRIGIVAIIVGLLVIQLLPYGRDHTNPSVLQEPAWDNLQTRALTERACFDCHSNETRWPWYTHIAPVSMMVYKDVVEGRAVLNFSEWNAATWSQEQTDRLRDSHLSTCLPVYQISKT